MLDFLHFPTLAFRAILIMIQALAAAKEQGKPLLLIFTVTICCDKRGENGSTGYGQIPGSMKRIKRRIRMVALYIDERITNYLSRMDIPSSSYDDKVKTTIGKQKCGISDYQFQ